MKRRVLESAIENRTNTKAKELGYISRKMNGLGFRSWPDRLFLSFKGNAVFIEFKRPGETATESQAHLHQQLRKMGFDVQVFDNVDKAFQYLKKKQRPWLK